MYRFFVGKRSKPAYSFPCIRGNYFCHGYTEEVGMVMQFDFVNYLPNPIVLMLFKIRR